MLLGRGRTCGRPGRAASVAGGIKIAIAPGFSNPPGSPLLCPEDDALPERTVRPSGKRCFAARMGPYFSLVRESFPDRNRNLLQRMNARCFRDKNRFWENPGGRNPRKDRECPKIEEGERFCRLGSVGPETGAGRAYLPLQPMRKMRISDPKFAVLRKKNYFYH